ncbi:nicotinate (nicotinamide) nucleotide adenylyltransferase [Candidatus Pacearchaeota archaeon]|nr:nicotinate (nicotinamide) nucleotide adenylyltransferase [Candidatus Pacearchaeota archaeon]
MKVGLFGGSFNPIHKSHIEVINKTLESKVVEEVWIIPCKEHAFGKNLLNSEQRIRMIEYAIKEIDSVKINRVELNSKGINYTIDTVRKLKKEFNHDFYFIIGSDVLPDLPYWKKNEELVELVNFLVFERKGYLIRKEPQDMTVQRGSFFEVSSTEIRERVAKGKPISRLVFTEVENYIIREGLYNDRV